MDLTYIVDIISSVFVGDILNSFYIILGFVPLFLTFRIGRELFP